MREGGEGGREGGRHMEWVDNVEPERSRVTG